MRKWTQDDRLLELIQGDITDQQVDAIVNAANRRLAGGGGVDGAIHRRGGPTIIAETRQRYPHGCPTGSAVISTAGQLCARHIIHAVGPVWSGGQRNEADQLRGAYQSCLDLAAAHACNSVAFPSLSTGAYRYPLPQASHIALSTCLEHLRANSIPQRIVFVLFETAALDTFAETLSKIGTASG